MVNQLLATTGAAQDGNVFRFAADVNADQTTEIDRMTRMLDALKRELSVNQKITRGPRHRRALACSVRDIEARYVDHGAQP